MTFRNGDAVRYSRFGATVHAIFIQEEQNEDGRPNGVALIEVTGVTGDRSYTVPWMPGHRVHLGIRRLVSDV